MYAEEKDPREMERQKTAPERQPRIHIHLTNTILAKQERYIIIPTH